MNPARTARPAALLILALGSASPIAAQPASTTRDPGIYLENPEGQEPTRLVGVRADVRATGVVKMMLTSGLAKGEMLGRISGEHATLRTSDQPVFDFYLPSGSSDGSSPPSGDMSQLDVNQMMRSMDGDLIPPNVHDATDFALVRLESKDAGREVHLGSLGGHFGGSGLKNTVACAVEKLANGAFRVRPKSPLPPGEYAFTVAKQDQAGQLWDFGVDGK